MTHVTLSIYFCNTHIIMTYLLSSIFFIQKSYSTQFMILRSTQGLRVKGRQIELHKFRYTTKLRRINCLREEGKGPWFFLQSNSLMDLFIK
jgi:hypothetical protein